MDIHIHGNPGFLSVLLCLTPPLWGNPLECRDEIWHQKTRIMRLPDGEEIATSFFVLTQYRLVTDRHVAVAKTSCGLKTG